MIIQKIKSSLLRNFLGRCLIVVFLSFLIEVYFLLYFGNENIYAPFVDGGLAYYKACLFIEFLLSLAFLFLLAGGLIQYKSINQKSDKVWFCVFALVISLWFSTHWYKLGIAYTLGSDIGLLYRSPLQNLVSSWLFGIKSHYEPGIYLVHQTYLSMGLPLDFSSVLDSNSYLDAEKFYNFVCDGRSSLYSNLQKYNLLTDPEKLKIYIQAINRFNEAFKIKAFFADSLPYEKSSFYETYFYYFVL